jgi:aspartate/methionine/tyrosine aminotransferase
MRTIIYDGKHYSFNEIIERSVVLNSFSKSFAVPGWRLGYLTAPHDLVDHLAKMQYHLVACPPPLPSMRWPRSSRYRKGSPRGLIPVFKRRRKTMGDALKPIEDSDAIIPKVLLYLPIL